MQLRILPTLIMVCCILFLARMNDLFFHPGQEETVMSPDIFFIRGAVASAKAEKKPEEGEEEKETGGQETKAKDKEETKEADKKENKTEHKVEEKKEEKKTETENAELPTSEAEEKTFSQSELDILENLAERRKKLENWEQTIQLKEKVLEATEQRISSKIEELKKIQDEVKLLLNAYNAKEDEKINRLVKIYETMKPKDAAKIFEELDMPVVLKVIAKMKEAKTAPILANMNAVRAKEITTELVKQNHLSFTPY